MRAPRAVAIVGFKAAGKTLVVEALVSELVRRGKSVGTIKHTAEDAPMDSPGTDTRRHVEAGATAAAILSDKRSAVFMERTMELFEAVAFLGAVDYVVLEGFKSLGLCPRVIVPKKPEDVKELSNGLEVALVNVAGDEKAEGSLPVLYLDDVAKLADIVEAKSFPLLSGMDCGGCGYSNCRELGQAILRGESSAETCVGYSAGVSLKVNGVQVPLKPFVQDAFRGIVFGFVKTLKGVGEPHDVEIEVKGND